jgi:DNA repair protein RadC
MDTVRLQFANAVLRCSTAGSGIICLHMHPGTDVTPSQALICLILFINDNY